MSNFDNWFQKRFPNGPFANDYGMRTIESQMILMMKEAYYAGIESVLDINGTYDEFADEVIHRWEIEELLEK